MARMLRGSSLRSILLARRHRLHPGSRCERCQDAGTLTVKLHFLPEVEVRCPDGTPEDVAKAKGSYTGQRLKEVS